MKVRNVNHSALFSLVRSYHFAETDSQDLYLCLDLLIAFYWRT